MRKILGFSLFMVGCASSSITIYDPQQVRPHLEKNIPGEYEQVFKAAQMSLADYPIEVNDMEAGFLQTTFIKNEQAWSPPHLGRKLPGGFRYTLSIQVLRLKNEKMSKIIITKSMQHKKNFFAKYRPVKTDGLEEIALLYRIQRELWLQSIAE